MRMKRYDKYKDSGIAWLGKIPEHWKVTKINRAFSLIGSGTTPKSGDPKYYDNGTINWLNTGDLNDGLITETSRKITKEALDDFSTLKIYPQDSIVIALYGATIGKLGFLNIETTTNQACCVISESNKITQKYLFYFLLSSKEHIISMSYGGGQPNISQELIRQLPILHLSFEEQQKIAAYLDHTVDLIDSTIKQKQAQSERLQAYRKSMINEVVTKGLNPDAPMRDSGIEWLGEIPKHWKITRVKNIVHLISEKLPNSTSVKVGLENIETKTGKFIPTESVFEGEGVEFLKEDILFGKLRPYLAKVYLSDFKGQAVGDFFVFRAKDKVLPKYIANLFLSDFFISVVDGSTYGAKMPRANWDFISNTMIALPETLNEQTQIVNHIEQRTTKIDKITAELKAQIDKLKEYKTAIISEAVTGKIDLREWVEPTKK